MVDKSDKGLSPIVLIVVVVMVLMLAGVLSWWGKQAAQRHALPEGEQLETYTNGLGMQLVKIPGGRFVMGEEGVAGRSPQHEVRVASFYMSAHEVTQAQWMAVMGENPSAYKDPRRPVDQVNWLAVQAFLEALNRLEGTNKYRLPTEAEWEYAARAGTDTRYFFGDEPTSLRRFAWFGLGNGTRPVGMKEPNQWGLFDMYGNVWEWVQECWHSDYTDAPDDSRLWGGGDCSHRTLRGGGWNATVDYLGSTVRGSYPSIGEDVSNGFRVVLSL